MLCLLLENGFSLIINSFASFQVQFLSSDLRPHYESNSDYSRVRVYSQLFKRFVFKATNHFTFVVLLVSEGIMNCSKSMVKMQRSMTMI